jgi:choline monooxygenase
MSTESALPDLAAVSRPIETARGLPNACYVSDAYFAAERERLFARAWTCIGVGADVPAAGDMRPVDLAGWPLLMVRGRDGQIRVFHNVCSHRGSTLLERPGNAPTIRCPYHSWTYDLNGRLLRTPDAGGPGVDAMPSLRRDELGLREVRSACWLDFVFINVAENAEPLEAWLQPLQERWAHYALDQLRHGGTAEFVVRANWKLATENTMEYYHLPWVHRSLNSYSPTHAHYHCNAGDRFVGTATRDYRPPAAERSLPQFPGLTDEEKLVGEYPVVFPNLWLGVQVDHLFAMVVYPQAPARTVERLHLYFVGDAAMAPEYAAARAEIIERWRAINLEDIGATERLQAGRASPGFDGGRLSPVQDFAGHHFMRTVARYMAPSG